MSVLLALPNVQIARILHFVLNVIPFIMPIMVFVKSVIIKISIVIFVLRTISALNVILDIMWTLILVARGVLKTVWPVLTLIPALHVMMENTSQMGDVLTAQLAVLSATIHLIVLVVILIMKWSCRIFVHLSLKTVPIMYMMRWWIEYANIAHPLKC